MRALVLRGVVNVMLIFVAGFCRRPVGACRLLGLLLHVSHGPGLSWDSRRALMPHGVAGLSFLRHDVVEVGGFTPHLTSTPFAPVVIILDVFDDSIMDSFRVVL